jgi:hypothetical protein
MFEINYNTTPRRFEASSRGLYFQLDINILAFLKTLLEVFFYDDSLKKAAAPGIGRARRSAG